MKWGNISKTTIKPHCHLQKQTKKKHFRYEITAGSRHLWDCNLVKVTTASLTYRSLFWKTTISNVSYILGPFFRPKQVQTYSLYCCSFWDVQYTSLNEVEVVRQVRAKEKYDPGMCWPSHTGEFPLRLTTVIWSVVRFIGLFIFYPTLHAASNKIVTRNLWFYFFFFKDYIFCSGRKTCLSHSLEEGCIYHVIDEARKLFICSGTHLLAGWTICEEFYSKARQSPFT